VSGGSISVETHSPGGEPSAKAIDADEWKVE
jgi:hypothetical protein